MNNLCHPILSVVNHYLNYLVMHSYVVFGSVRNGEEKITQFFYVYVQFRVTLPVRWYGNY